jgi:predicted kinase
MTAANLIPPTADDPPIYLIVGPPAVGKSTTSRRLSARFSKSIHIPVDDLRMMVVSGLLLPDVVWSEDLAKQITLARSSAATMALNYHAAGYMVVLDDFWDANYRSDYRALLSHPNFHKVVLFPSQAEAHQRNMNRSGDNPARAYIDEGIRIVYQQINSAVPPLPQDGWLVFDTTSLSVDETVAAILNQTISGG